MSIPPSQVQKIDHTTPQCRKLGVIVITDNRLSQTVQKNQSKDFRGSAFKETQVDPLEFPKADFTSIHDLDLFAELNRRVTGLEERVQALTVIEKMQRPSDLPSLREKKRNRRKFGQLVRIHECQNCLKKYGSGTALKNHEKIKHGKEPWKDEDHK